MRIKTCLNFNSGLVGNLKVPSNLYSKEITETEKDYFAQL